MLKSRLALAGPISTFTLLLGACALGACTSEDPGPASGGQPGVSGSGGAAVGGSAVGGGGSSSGSPAAGTGGSAGAAAGGASGSGGSGGGSSAGCVVSKTDEEQPTLLSQTGCVDMASPAKPAPGLVPYSVRSALWSDGATKERFMRVPDGMKIHALDCAVDVDACKDPGLGGSGADEGHFEMPVGSVLVKNFSIDGKHIETRLFMRRSTQTWKGFSYEWNDPPTEATLIPDTAEFAMGKDRPLGGGAQIWHYPSRDQCLECHTKFAGRSLGPTTAQLNSDYAYPDGTANQLQKLTELGLFDVAPKNIAGYPDPAGTGTLEERARSYMQANCSICHRPGGEFSTIDMRFVTPFATTNLCGASERDTGTAVPAQRIVPGNPAMSAMSFRMHDLGDFRMPKIGSNMVDPAGTKLIDDWITALPTNACPLPQ